jgi:hypothetical protein
MVFPCFTGRQQKSECLHGTSAHRDGRVTAKQRSNGHRSPIASQTGASGEDGSSTCTSALVSKSLVVSAGAPPRHNVCTSTLLRCERCGLNPLFASEAEATHTLRRSTARRSVERGARLVKHSRANAPNNNEMEPARLAIQGSARYCLSDRIGQTRIRFHGVNSRPARGQRRALKSRGHVR